MSENLRTRTIEYINKHGIKQKFICEQTGINKSYFCLWINGKKKYLNQKSYQELLEFLDKNDK